MAGFFDMFGSDPKSQGMLAAAAQILQSSGPSFKPTGLGQILGGGLEAYQQTEQRAREQGQIGQMRGLQIKGAESDLAAQQRAREEELLFAGMAKNFTKTPGQQAAALPGGPTPGNAAQIPGMSTEFDMNGYIDAMMAYNPIKALELRRSMAKAAPKFDSGITFVNGPDGKPMAVRTADDGSFKQLDGIAPREKLEFRDTGNAVLGVNPYTGERQASLAKGLSPDAVASNALGYANLNLSKERLGIERERAVQGRSAVVQSDAGPLVVNTRTGAGVPVIGPDGQVVGPKLRDVPATARKAMFENDAALRKIDDALTAIDAYPDALGVSNYLGDTIRQRTDPDGVNARALVADVGSLKIHDRSGAAVTASETPRLMPFIPSATDDVKTAKKKLSLFKNEYAAIQQDMNETYSRDQGYRTPAAPKAAAPSASAAPSKPLKSAIKGQVMDGYRFKGGNPSDRNAWEKI